MLLPVFYTGYLLLGVPAGLMVSWSSHSLGLQGSAEDSRSLPLEGTCTLLAGDSVQLVLSFTLHVQHLTVTLFFSSCLSLFCQPFSLSLSLSLPYNFASQVEHHSSFHAVVVILCHVNIPRQILI